MDLENQVRRADRAKQLLADELVVEAREQIEQALWEAFKNSPIRDSEGREHLRLMLDCHTKFFGYLQRVVEDGSLARLELEGKRKGLLKFM